MRKLLLFLVLITCIGFIAGDDLIKAYTGGRDREGNVKEKKGKEQKGLKNEASPGISIVRRWDLPEVLKEVSGIAYLDKDRFACVQDELGSVFIFNRTTARIEKEVPFGPPGDYEGITLAGREIYVVRSDGTLFRINELNAAKPAVSVYETALTATQNIEGLCYDAPGNRLLLAVKDEEPGNKPYKGIYAFSLEKKSLQEEPVYRISLNDELSRISKGKKEKLIRPSAIGRVPGAPRYFVLDGPNAGLLIMNEQGRLLSRCDLGKQAFAKPEGITFSPEGSIYISNEGKKDPANITEIRLHQ